MIGLFDDFFKERSSNLNMHLHDKVLIHIQVLSISVKNYWISAKFYLWYYVWYFVVLR